MKIHYNSPVVLTFALISTAVFFLNQATGGTLNTWFTLSPQFNFTSLHGVVTFVSYVLGHANLEHLMGNMTFILLLGPIMEEKYGSKNLLLMIIFTAIATGILNNLFFSTGILGASGIVFMFILLVSFTNNSAGKIPLTFILVLILFVGKEVINSLEADQISQFAHIIGGVFGSIFGFIFPRKPVDEYDAI